MRDDIKDPFSWVLPTIVVLILLLVVVLTVRDIINNPPDMRTSVQIRDDRVKWCKERGGSASLDHNLHFTGCVIPAK